MSKLSASHRRILLDLLALPTAPFLEQHVVAYVRRFCDRHGLQIRADRFGNLLLHYRRGRARKRPLAFSAHMDHPGFEVMDCPSAGRVVARWRGGVRAEYFRGARVRFRVGDQWVRGRIRSLELSASGTAGPKRVHRVRIELSRRAEVPTGSIGMWDLPEPAIRGSRVYARDCDDIAGVAGMLCMMDVLCRRRSQTEVYCVFTRAEEVGFAGCLSACAARTLPKRCAVVGIECSSMLAGAAQGAGPILRVGDRMSVFSPALGHYCRAVAEGLVADNDGFSFQRKLMDGGACESTAYCAAGYEATGICLALGNYHNMDVGKKRIGPEHIHLGDFADMVSWFVGLATTRRPFDPRGGATDPKLLQTLRRRYEAELLRTARRASG